MEHKIPTLFLILIQLVTTLPAQNNLSALLPIPAKAETYTHKKTFDIRKTGKLITQLPDTSFLIGELKSIIEQRTGIALKNSGKGHAIEIREVDGKNREWYSIDVTHNRLTLSGGSKAGIFYALKTLDQMLLGDTHNSSNGKIAQTKIEDEPRYPMRAVMLDPARHFLPVDDVKFFIDQISKYKYNTLQMHLTDDQGWRIEIKSHPLLTQKGAFRKEKGSINGPDNGYYTQQDLKEIIAYAADRNVEIIPELDIPGHSAAIIATYPRLSCPFRHNEKITIGETTNVMLCAHNTLIYDIYSDIIEEVARIFPSPHIHLGGDEAAIKDNWAKCDSCLNMMRKAGYSEPSQLMNIFFGKILDIVRSNNKKAILWCELDNIWPPANDYLFPYPEDVTLVTWRNGLTPKCIELTRKYGHNLIMAPGEHTYLDYPQWKNDLPEFNNWGMPTTTLQKTYELDPGYSLPSSEQQHIQGVMATMWGEAIKDINRVNYMFFPRGLAVSEAAWSSMQQRSWESFKERLYPNLYDLMKCGVSFRVPFEISN